MEDFAIRPTPRLTLGNVSFSFHNPTLFLLLPLSVVFWFVSFFAHLGGITVPNAVPSMIERVHDFVPNPAYAHIEGALEVQRIWPSLSVTFSLSLFRNPGGVVPFSCTVTTHLLCTGTISLAMFIGSTGCGLERNGLLHLLTLCPPEVPLSFAPLLVLLELLPHWFRAFSSGIRCFANMLAGKCSVKILTGSAWTMLLLIDRGFLLGDTGVFLLVMALSGLELGVAISQAHVSTISLGIYLKDSATTPTRHSNLGLGTLLRPISLAVPLTMQRSKPPRYSRA